MTRRRGFAARVAMVACALAAGACGSPPTPPTLLASMENDEVFDRDAAPTTVRVRVVDESGRGVGGASIQVTAHWSASRGPDCGVVGDYGFASGTTTDDGTFGAVVRSGAHVNGIAAAAVLDDRSGTSDYVAWKRNDGAPPALVVKLAPGVWIKGRVDESSGAPAAGANVYCTWRGNAFELRTTTAADGRWRVGPIPADAARDDARLDARVGDGSGGWFVEGGRVRDVAPGAEVVMRLPPPPHWLREKK